MGEILWLARVGVPPSNGRPLVLAECERPAGFDSLPSPQRFTAEETVMKRILIKVICLECSKKFSVGPNASPECPKCGGVDIDVRE